MIPLLRLGRTTKKLVAIGSLVLFVQAILWYFIPIYFEDVLTNMLLVGTAISAYSAASLLISLPAGDIIDRVGRRFAFAFGIIGLVVSIFFLFIGEFAFLFLFMFLFGAFTQICGSAVDASLMDHCTRKNVGRIMGLADGFDEAAWAFGPIAAACLLLLFEVPLFISIIVVLLVAISAFALLYFPGRQALGLGGIKKSEKILIEDALYLGEVRRLKELGRPLIAMMLFFFAFGFWEYAIWTFSPIWTNALGAGLVTGALILAASSLPFVLCSPTAGALMGRLGPNKMLAIGTVAVLSGQTIFMFEQSFATLAACFATTAVGLAFIMVPLDVFVKERVRWRVYGELFGAEEMAYEVGGVIAPLSVGVIAMEAEMTSVIYVSFALFAVAVAALFLLFRNWQLASAAPREAAEPLQACNSGAAGRRSGGHQSA